MILILILTMINILSLNILILDLLISVIGTFLILIMCVIHYLIKYKFEFYFFGHYINYNKLDMSEKSYEELFKAE